MLLPYPRFCAYFSLQTLQFLLVGCKNSFFPGRRYPCYATDHTECPYYVIIALLRHLQIELIEGRKIDNPYRTCLTEIVQQRRRSILFSMFMFMPVVPAILVPVLSSVVI